MEIIVKFINSSVRFFEFDFVKKGGKKIYIDNEKYRELESEERKEIRKLIIEKIEKSEGKEVRYFRLLEDVLEYND